MTFQTNFPELGPAQINLLERLIMAKVIGVDTTSYSRPLEMPEFMYEQFRIEDRLRAVQRMRLRELLFGSGE